MEIFFFFSLVGAVLWLQKQNLWFQRLRFDAKGCGTFYATWRPGALNKYLAFHPFEPFSLC